MFLIRYIIDSITSLIGFAFKIILLMWNVFLCVYLGLSPFRYYSSGFFKWMPGYYMFPSLYELVTFLLMFGLAVVIFFIRMSPWEYNYMKKPLYLLYFSIVCYILMMHENTLTPLTFCLVISLFVVLKHGKQIYYGDSARFDFIENIESEKEEHFGHIRNYMNIFCGVQTDIQNVSYKFLFFLGAVYATVWNMYIVIIIKCYNEFDFSRFEILKIFNLNTVYSVWNYLLFLIPCVTHLFLMKRHQCKLQEKDQIISKISAQCFWLEVYYRTYIIAQDYLKHFHKTPKTLLYNTDYLRYVAEKLVPYHNTEKYRNLMFYSSYYPEHLYLLEELSEILSKKTLRLLRQNVPRRGAEKGENKK